MDEEIKRTYNSLPKEEKEQLQKYQKKGITKVTQSVDQETGEILSTKTTLQISLPIILKSFTVLLSIYKECFLYNLYLKYFLSKSILFNILSA